MNLAGDEQQKRGRGLPGTGEGPTSIYQTAKTYLLRKCHLMKILGNFVYGTIKESLIPGGSFVFLFGLLLYHRARGTRLTRDRIAVTFL